MTLCIRIIVKFIRSEMELYSAWTETNRWREEEKTLET